MIVSRTRVSVGCGAAVSPSGDLGRYGMAARLFITAAVLAAAIGCGSKEQESEPPEDVVAVTEARIQHDLGYIEPEGGREAVYRIPNREGRPLKILNAQSDCVCLIMRSVPDEIPPGGSGDVRVWYQSSEKREHYIGRVLLETDSAEMPRVLITVRADVGLPLCISPRGVDIGTVKPGESRQAEILLVNRGTDGVRATHGGSSDPECTVQVPQVEVPGGGRLRLPVQINAGNQPGPRSVQLYVETDLSHQPSVECRVSYTVADDEGGA